MLDVNIEFVRGILIVRLEGKLNNISTRSVRDNLISIIRNGGIKYLMFNIVNSKIEEKIDMFDECNKLIKENDGKMYVCGLKRELNAIVTNIDTVEKISNELSVLNRIRLC